jgi:N-acetyl-gamma-glutamyl-phosphate reductase
MSSEPPKVGILGASGYMGGEALRVLLEHPGVDVAWATSRTPGPAERYHPNLTGAGVELIHPDDAAPTDLVLAALPVPASIAAARRYLDAGSAVIDLGAAFRLRDRPTWERVYGCEHPDWALAEQAAYGVPELRADAIAAARLVANPGCFSSAAILGLAPLLAAGWIEPGCVVVDGLSGTAGVGAELWRGAHHPEIGNNLVPYNGVDHRHGYEMEQELSCVAGVPVRVHFTPVYVPVVRGILDLCHGLLTGDRSRDAVVELYRDYYRDQEFVQIIGGDSGRDDPGSRGSGAEGAYHYRAYPWVSAVAGTNFCFIGVDVDPARGRVVVFSALDSIGKGGAQVGVENMNLMLGLPRGAGLGRRGLHPA